MIKITNNEKLRYFLFLIVPLLAYLNSLKNGFVWDDHLFIEASPFIKDWRNILQMFTPSYFTLSWKTLDVNRPLMVLSLMADYYVWGLNALGYHLTNILLHTANTGLVFLFFRHVSIGQRSAVFASLLFAVHPIQTEAVNGINFREDLLATFFILLGILHLIKFVASRRQRHYAISVWSFLMALLSKETAVMFFPIALAYLYIFDRRIGKRYYIPYIGILLAYLLFLSSVYPHSDLPKIGVINFGSLILSTVRYLLYSIKMIFLPTNLSIDHTTLMSTTIIGVNDHTASGVFLFFVMFTWLARRICSRATMLFLLFFITALLPPITVVYSYSMLIERLIYLPMVGFCGIVGSFANRPVSKKGIGIWLSILIFFSLLSVHRNSVWKNDHALRLDAVKKAPQSHIAHINLGNILLGQGDYEKATNEFLRSLKIKENDEAHYRLGMIYQMKDKHDLAIANFKAALNVPVYLEQSHISDLHNRLGFSYAKEGHYNEAIQEWLIYLKSNTKNAVTYTNLGSAYAKLGLIREAINAYTTALNIDPNNTDARKYLEIIKSRTGAK